MCFEGIVEVEWEQEPPECFGSGGHGSDGIFGDVPRDEPCDVDYCDYFCDCYDGTVEIVKEVNSGVTPCLGKWTGCTWLNVCPDERACHASLTGAVVITEEKR